MRTTRNYLLLTFAIMGCTACSGAGTDETAETYGGFLVWQMLGSAAAGTAILNFRRGMDWLRRRWLRRW